MVWYWFPSCFGHELLISFWICEKGPIHKETFFYVFVLFQVMAGCSRFPWEQKQYKNAGIRFRVYGAKDPLAVIDKFLVGFYVSNNVNLHN